MTASADHNSMHLHLMENTQQSFWIWWQQHNLEFGTGSYWVASQLLLTKSVNVWETRRLDLWETRAALFLSERRVSAQQSWGCLCCIFCLFWTVWNVSHRDILKLLHNFRVKLFFADWWTSVHVYFRETLSI